MMTTRRSMLMAALVALVAPLTRWFTPAANGAAGELTARANDGGVQWFDGGRSFPLDPKVVTVRITGHAHGAGVYTGELVQDAIDLKPGDMLSLAAFDQLLASGGAQACHIVNMLDEPDTHVLDENQMCFGWVRGYATDGKPVVVVCQSGYAICGDDD